MAERVLQGPFLTRGEAARAARIPPGLVVHRPDLLRLGGQFLEEVYFAFQFDHHGVRPDIGRVVQILGRQFDDIVIADWLARPNAGLNGVSPLDFLNRGGTPERVVAAAEHHGPSDEPYGIGSLSVEAGVRAAMPAVRRRPLVRERAVHAL